jgi:hypothetical protein
MYVDYTIPNGPTQRVVVIEETGTETPDEAIHMARGVDTVTFDGDGDEIFWIVFANEPRRLWDFTEKALRHELNLLSEGGRQ